MNEMTMKQRLAEIGEMVRSHAALPPRPAPVSRETVAGTIIISRAGVGGRWDQQDIDDAIRMTDDGHSSFYIGAVLGCSAAAVRTKLSRVRAAKYKEALQLKRPSRPS